MAGTTEWTVARKHASQWGTAVAVGAGDGVKIVSENLAPGIPTPILDENVGDSLAGAVYQGNIDRNTGNLILNMRYLGLERDLALFMGQSGVPTDVEAGPGPTYLHSFIFQPSNTGFFETLVLDKGIGSLGSKVHEHPSLKYSSIEMAHEEGKARLTLGCIYNKVERAVASQVNGATELGAVTIPSSQLLLLFSQLSVRLTEVTGSEGNLDSADDFAVTEGRLTANRNITGDIVSGSGGEIDEPETDGLARAQMVLSFAKYTAAVDALVEEAQIVQEGRQPKVYKAEMIWTGPAIPGTGASATYFLKWQLPAVTINDAPQNAPGPGQKVPVEMTFDIQTPQSVPDGSDWSWVTAGQDPFRVQVQNTNSANPLA